MISNKFWKKKVGKERNMPNGKVDNRKFLTIYTPIFMKFYKNKYGSKEAASDKESFPVYIKSISAKHCKFLVCLDQAELRKKDLESNSIFHSWNGVQKTNSSQQLPNRAKLRWFLVARSKCFCQGLLVLGNLASPIARPFAAVDWISLVYCFEWRQRSI